MLYYLYIYILFSIGILNFLLPFLVSNRLIRYRINKRGDEFNFFTAIYTAKASFNEHHSKILKKINM